MGNLVGNTKEIARLCADDDIRKLAKYLKKIKLGGSFNEPLGPPRLTVLHIACSENSPKAVKFLLEHKDGKVDVNITCNLGEPAAYKAIARGHVRALMALCEGAKNRLDLHWEKEGSPFADCKKLAEQCRKSKPDMRSKMDLCFLVKDAFVAYQMIRDKPRSYHAGPQSTLSHELHEILPRVRRGQLSACSLLSKADCADEDSRSADDDKLVEDVLNLVQDFLRLAFETVGHFEHPELREGPADIARLLLQAGIGISHMKKLASSLVSGGQWHRGTSRTHSSWSYLSHSGTDGPNIYQLKSATLTSAVLYFYYIFSVCDLEAVRLLVEMHFESESRSADYNIRQHRMNEQLPRQPSPDGKDEQEDSKLTSILPVRDFISLMTDVSPFFSSRNWWQTWIATAVSTIRTFIEKYEREEGLLAQKSAILLWQLRSRNEYGVHLSWGDLALTNNICDAALEEWPESQVRDFDTVRSAIMSKNNFKKVPQIVSKMDGLRYMSMSNCQSLETGLWRLFKLDYLLYLYLDGCNLQNLDDLIDIRSHWLTKLFLQDNKLTDLPKGLGTLRKLAHLDLSNNNLKKVPDCVYSMEGLRVLLLDHNVEINDLSQRLKNLKRLNKLGLGGLCCLDEKFQPLGSAQTASDMYQLMEVIWPEEELFLPTAKIVVTGPEQEARQVVVQQLEEKISECYQPSCTAVLDLGNLLQYKHVRPLVDRRYSHYVIACKFTSVKGVAKEVGSHVNALALGRSPLAIVAVVVCSDNPKEDQASFQLESKWWPILRQMRRKYGSGWIEFIDCTKTKAKFTFLANMIRKAFWSNTKTINLFSLMNRKQLKQDQTLREALSAIRTSDVFFEEEDLLRRIRCSIESNCKDIDLEGAFHQKNREKLHSYFEHSGQAVRLGRFSPDEPTTIIAIVKPFLQRLYSEVGPGLDGKPLPVISTHPNRSWFFQVGEYLGMAFPLSAAPQHFPAFLPVAAVTSKPSSTCGPGYKHRLCIFPSCLAARIPTLWTEFIASVLKTMTSKPTCGEMDFCFWGGGLVCHGKNHPENVIFSVEIFDKKALVLDRLQKSADGDRVLLTVGTRPVSNGGVHQTSSESLSDQARLFGDMLDVLYQLATEYGYFSPDFGTYGMEQRVVCPQCYSDFSLRPEESHKLSTEYVLNLLDKAIISSGKEVSLCEKEGHVECLPPEDYIPDICLLDLPGRSFLRPESYKRTAPSRRMLNTVLEFCKLTSGQTAAGELSAAEQAPAFVLKGLPQDTRTSCDGVCKLRQEVFTLQSLADCPNVVKLCPFVCFPDQFCENEPAEMQRSSSLTDSSQRKYSKFSMEMINGYTLFNILENGAIARSVVESLKQKGTADGKRKAKEHSLGKGNSSQGPTVDKGPNKASGDASATWGNKPSKLIPKFHFKLVLTIARELISALVGMHSKNVMHRDIKPSNIMVTVQELLGKLAVDVHVKVIDLGSKWRDCVTWPSACLGTQLYCAPEVPIFEKNKEESPIPLRYGYPSDVYSFGLVLYEVLAAKMIIDLSGKFKDGSFSHDNPAVDKMRRELKRVGQHQAVAEVAEKCTQTRPIDRPTAKDVAVFLDQPDCLVLQSAHKLPSRLAVKHLAKLVLDSGPLVLALVKDEHNGKQRFGLHKISSETSKDNEWPCLFRMSYKPTHEFPPGKEVAWISYAGVFLFVCLKESDKHGCNQVLQIFEASKIVSAGMRRCKNLERQLDNGGASVACVTADDDMLTIFAAKKEVSFIKASERANGDCSVRRFRVEQPVKQLLAVGNIAQGNLLWCLHDHQPKVCLSIVKYHPNGSHDPEGYNFSKPFDSFGRQTMVLSSCKQFVWVSNGHFLHLYHKEDSSSQILQEPENICKHLGESIDPKLAEVVSMCSAHNMLWVIVQSGAILVFRLIKGLEQKADCVPGYILQQVLSLLGHCPSGKDHVLDIMSIPARDYCQTMLSAGPALALLCEKSPHRLHAAGDRRDGESNHIHAGPVNTIGGMLAVWDCSEESMDMTVQQLEKRYYSPQDDPLLEKQKHQDNQRVRKDPPRPQLEKTGTKVPPAESEAEAEAAKLPATSTTTLATAAEAAVTSCIPKPEEESAASSAGRASIPSGPSTRTEHVAATLTGVPATDEAVATTTATTSATAVVTTSAISTTTTTTTTTSSSSSSSSSSAAAAAAAATTTTTTTTTKGEAVMATIATATSKTAQTVTGATGDASSPQSLVLVATASKTATAAADAAALTFTTAAAACASPKEPSVVLATPNTTVETASKEDTAAETFQGSSPGNAEVDSKQHTTEEGLLPGVNMASSRHVGLKASEILMLLGLKKHRVRGDGSCLYHAVAHQAGFAESDSTGDDDSVAQLRAQAVDIMKNHPHIQQEEGLNDNEWEKRKKDICQPNHWAGDLECRLLAVCLGCDLVVIVRMPDTAKASARCFSADPSRSDSLAGSRSTFKLLSTDTAEQIKNWQRQLHNPLFLLYNGTDHYDSTETAQEL